MENNLRYRDIVGTDTASDSDLCAFLRWAEEHGFSADPQTAFSLNAWQELGDRLVYELAYGDKGIVGLISTWRILFDILHHFRAGGDVSKGTALPEGGQLEGGTGGPSPPPPELVGVIEAVQSSYPSPRDYVPPTYPSPRNFVVPEYPSPAESLAKMTEQQKELERPPPFAPAALPSSAPLPSVAGVGLVIPAAPPLL